MTLVAAFTVDGIPALVGDFLITDTQPANHIFLPTRPELASVKPGKGKRRICGLRKKIHKIGERLVVGFTGDLRAGEQLIKGLINHFGDSNPTFNNFQKFLANANFSNKDKTELVGWIWEKRPICFHWKGSHPEKVVLVESAFSGSGGGHFLNEIMATDFAGMSPEMKTSLDRAIYLCALKAGKILYTELLSANNLDFDYGYGAEIILWDGAKFFYVEKLAYSFWNVLVNKDNSLTFAPSNIIAIYKNCGLFSIMQVAHLGPKTSLFPGLEAKDTYTQLITPINDDMNAFDIRDIERLDYDSELWFSGFAVFNPDKQERVDLTLVSECSEDIEPLVSHKHGILYVRLDDVHAMLQQSGIFN